MLGSILREILRNRKLSNAQKMSKQSVGGRGEKGTGSSERREGQVMKSEILFLRQVAKTLVNLRALRSIA